MKTAKPHKKHVEIHSDPKRPLAQEAEAPSNRTPVSNPDLNRLLAPLPIFGFFVAYAFCLCNWINVALIYHGSGMVQDFPSFYWGWSFASEFRTHPGGLVEYTSALIAQSMCISWFGALVLSVQAALVYTALAGSVRKLGADGFRFLCLAPPLLMLAIYSKYRHYSIAIESFAIGAVTSWLWLRLGSRRPLKRLGFAVVLTAILYAVAPSSLFVFLPAVASNEVLSRTRLWHLLSWLLLSAAVPVAVGAILFGFAPAEAYAKILPLPWDPIVLKMAGIRLVVALFCFPLMFSPVIVLWKLLVAKVPEGPSDAAGIRYLWKLPFALVLPVLVVWAALNPQIKALMQIDYCAWNAQWPGLLAAASRANPANPAVNSAIVQAKYHLGTLVNELPILAAPGDLVLFNDKQQSHWRKSDLYYDLGYLNMALHHLTESVEFYGERPVLLRRLALVNLALGNLNTAKVYLGTLARAPFQGAWANDYLQRLQLDPALSNDVEILRLRRFMVRRDSVVALSPEDEFSMLLEANRQNRMAFEYLMTYYLLSKNLDGFVKNIARVNDFSGLTISSTWDEALVLASRLAGRPLKITGHVISQEATSRVETVTHAVQQFQDNAVLARHQLSPQFGHTYTFYWWFHE